MVMGTGKILSNYTINMKLDLEQYEIEFIDSVLYDKYHIYSNKNPIIPQIRDKIEAAENDAWNQYVLSKITW